jgi:hypothetical protein
MEPKYQSLLDNYINGNLSDFKAGIRKLTKQQIVGFILYIDPILCDDKKLFCIMKYLHHSL